jgi:hypothetical protein
MNDETEYLERAGKAIGGSPLWHVKNARGEVAGTITEVFPDLVRLYLNGVETWHPSKIEAGKAALA